MRFLKKLENLRKHRNIKLVATERKRHLKSEPNYDITAFFTENLLAKEMRKILMNEPVIYVCRY